jgi:hypothetical protein
VNDFSYIQCVPCGNIESEISSPPPTTRTNLWFGGGDGSREFGVWKVVGREIAGVPEFGGVDTVGIILRSDGYVWAKS